MNYWTAFSTIFAASCLALASAGCDGDGPDSTDSETSETSSDTTEDTTETDGDTDTDTDTMPECTMDSDCETGEVCQDGTCAPEEPSFWSVGGDGTVLRVAPQSGSAVHPFESTADLQAIACHGEATAWLVGKGGVVGFTDNGGATWEIKDLGLTADLHDVAIAEPLRVALAGDDGTLFVSTGTGDDLQFSALPGPEGSLQGVDATAVRTAAVGADGAIWWHAYGDPEAIKVADAGVALRAIDLSDHQLHGAAVGDGGVLLWTDDGGQTWAPRSSGTELDLHAVQVGADDPVALAVGQDGVVIRIDQSGAHELHAGGVDLYAVHLDASGRGAISGADGLVYYATDEAQTLTVVETGVTVDILGVDALGVHHW